MSGQRLLVVDDSETIRFALQRFLQAQGYDVVTRETCAAAVEELSGGSFDAAIVDYMLPDGTALDILGRLKQAGSLLPIVILTAHGSIDLAVRALQEGAAHFLTKPVELPALLVVVRRLVEGERVVRRERAVRNRQSRRTADPFLGTSSVIRALRTEAERVAQSDSGVLIHGETGTGKGVLAAWLHANSPRSEESFVDLNCAGLTPQFLETELFGHEKGAFTGAVAAKAGLLELAHKGTLFLDEVGDIDPAVQPKLLKALEERRFRRLGEVRDRTVDVRFIAASHQSLERLVRERKFRSDLYFRVSALPLDVPALRDRPEDIAPIARRLLSSMTPRAEHHELDLSTEAIDVLASYSWPGNIRELRNVLERAALFATGSVIEKADLRLSGTVSQQPPPQTIPGDQTAEIVSLAENEKRYLERVLRSAGGRVEEAAKVLGLPRSSLYERLKRFGITPSRG